MADLASHGSQPHDSSQLTEGPTCRKGASPDRDTVLGRAHSPVPGSPVPPTAMGPAVEQGSRWLTRSSLLGGAVARPLIRPTSSLFISTTHSKYVWQAKNSKKNGTCAVSVTWFCTADTKRPACAFCTLLCPRLQSFPAMKLHVLKGRNVLCTSGA